jgi:toxin-antitoxin system PIN domain toxin
VPGYFVDTNVWIAYYFKGHPHQAIAAEFMSGRSGDEPAVLFRTVEQSFLRLLTTPAICRGYNAPTITNPVAVEILEGWSAQPHIRCLDAEPAGTRELWLELAAIPSASPKVWMDAYLAAFAIRAGLPLATLDADFCRFEAAGLDLLLLSA